MPLSNEVQVFEADLANSSQASAVVEMIDVYARDPTANGAPLPESVKRDLAPRLRAHPGVVAILALCDAKPVGVAVCFLGFSTFAARPLLNVHDLVVAPEYRGRGISVRLLAAAETAARARGCCKLTLEVLANNARAIAIYRRFGFDDYQLDPTMGAASLMQKKVVPDIR